jgi:hypothetical protein
MRPVELTGLFRASMGADIPMDAMSSVYEMVPIQEGAAATLLALSPELLVMGLGCCWPSVGAAKQGGGRW